MSSLWPAEADLAAIEAVPLVDRALPASTYALLDRAAGLWPDHEATVFLPDLTAWQKPVTSTFAALRRRVHRIANVFTDLGVGRRDAVAFLAPNSGGLLAALLAAQAVGVAQPINPTLAPAAIGGLLRLGGARLIVAAEPSIELAAELGKELGVPVLALHPDDFDPLDAQSRADVPSLDELAAAQPDDRLLAADRAAPGDLASYFHTGGTTGAPKLAAHTHANEVTMAWSMAAGLLTPDDATVLAGLPLFHVNALLVTVLAPLFLGQRALWTGPLGYRDPQLYGVFWQLVEHYRVVSMSAVPTVYAVLTQVPVDADISSLALPVVGASPLPTAVRDRWAEHTGVPLREGYGLTEATCASARTIPGLERPGSVGQRLPYQRIKAVDADGRDLPPGQVGALRIAGPTVFAGYLRPGPDGRPVPDPTGVVVDGWLETGDRGSVDTDGYVRLVGREKDLIIRGGHNIDPAMVEEALLDHPDVTGATVVGRPDAHAGEVPVAYVTLRAGAATSADDLLAWAATGVPERAAVPKAVHVVDALPVTSVGKPFKPALRADAVRRVAAAELAAAGIPEAPPDAAVEVEIRADGSPLVRLDRPADPDTRDALGAALDRYTFAWTYRS